MPETAIQLAYDLWDEIGEDIHDLSNPNDCQLLIKQQKEYDDLVQELARNQHILNALNSLIEDEQDRKKRQIIAHIGLLSKKKKTLDITQKKTFLASMKALSLCKEKVVIFWMGSLVRAAINLGFLEDIADFIAKNDHPEYVHHFFNGEGKLISRGMDEYEMLAYSKHPNILPILMEEINTQSEFYAAQAAIALLIAGKQEGLDYFKSLLISEEYYENAGREVALYGDKKDLDLLVGYYNKFPVETSYLANMSMSGDMSLMRYYYEILKTQKDETQRQVAHYFLLGTFVPEEDKLPFEEVDDEEDINWDIMIPLWDLWLADNYKKYSNIRYYKDGQPFNVKTTLDEVRERYADGVSHARWERVVVYTGKILPYDPMAYYEKQLRQIKAMEDWVDENIEKFPNGRWYRFGKDMTDSSTSIIE